MVKLALVFEKQNLILKSSDKDYFALKHDLIRLLNRQSTMVNLWMILMLFFIAVLVVNVVIVQLTQQTLLSLIFATEVKEDIVWFLFAIDFVYLLGAFIPVLSQCFFTTQRSVQQCKRGIKY